MEDQVEEVKRKTDIVGLVGQYVVLKKLGRHHKGLCPFHSEKTPSFMVNEELGLYKCFGCGAGGDVIKFLMEIEGMDFRDALERLAEKAGVKLVSFKSDDGGEKQKLYDLMDLAARYYHWLLTDGKSGEDAREYLKERKINTKLIETFNIGYALPGWDNLINYLVKKKGYKEELLEKVGLVSRRSSGGFYDKFRGRLMFPLQNSSGKVVGFSGRILPSQMKENEPKYMNSPETEIYHKGSMLYGFTQAKQAIRETKKVVLVEGQMDMVSSFGAGVTETVAVGGTALTAEQVEMIARLSKNIVLSLDADEAGIAAIKRAVDIAEKRGLEIKVVQIEGGKDPDEIARNTPGKWKEMVNEAVGVYEFVLMRALAKHDITQIEGIKKITEEVIPFLSKIENSVVREVWIKKLAEKIGVEPTVVKSEMARGQANTKSLTYAIKKEEGLEPIDGKIEKLTKRLIGGLLINPEARAKLKPWTSKIGLTGGLGKVIAYVVSSEDTEPSVVAEKAPAELKSLIEEAYMAEGDGETDEKTVMSLMVQLFREVIREKRKILTEGLKKDKVDEQEEERLLKELNELDREESKILVLLG